MISTSRASRRTGPRARRQSLPSDGSKRENQRQVFQHVRDRHGSAARGGPIGLGHDVHRHQRVAPRSGLAARRRGAVQLRYPQQQHRRVRHSGHGPPYHHPDLRHGKYHSRDRSRGDRRHDAGWIPALAAGRENLRAGGGTGKLHGSGLHGPVQRIRHSSWTHLRKPEFRGTPAFARRRRPCGSVRVRQRGRPGKSLCLSLHFHVRNPRQRGGERGPRHGQYLQNQIGKHHLHVPGARHRRNRQLLRH